MLDKPDQDQVYTERLKNYIESFIQHVQNHPGYLQQWTMQSILDALFNAQSETLGESVDEFIENSIAEIEAQLVMEEQKFALLTEEDSDDPNDDDHANEEMENVFKYPFADMRIEKKTDTPDNTRVDTESLRRSSSNASVSSEQSTNTAASFIELSEKFHNTMSQFQNQTLPKGIDKHGKKILETNIDQITRNMFDLYENCFQNGITQESINTFEKAFQSIISNWSYWSEKELSASSSPHIAQSLAKLTMNLYKITQEMHRNCQAEITPPGSPKGM